MQLTLEQVRYWMDAEFPGGPAHAAVATGYSIDSRTISAGDLFFAIHGEQLNGHDYVLAALAGGAVAAVVARSEIDRYADPNVQDRLLVVDDTLHALQALAHAVRRHWGKRLIAITGSAGKTTTKEAIAAVLSLQYQVLKSHGNLNNGYGLPLQLLRLQPEHEVAVVELGMSHVGEIAALAKIAAPDWGVVTNVGVAHAENFPDGQTGIARAKYELIAALPRHGMAFLNCDDAYVSQFGRDFPGTAIYFGVGSCADLQAKEIQALGALGTRFQVAAGEHHADVTLQLLGKHNVMNVLPAIAIGMASGISLEACASALASLTAPEKRGQIVKFRGAMLLNDCYNCNPAALDAMVDVLRSIPAKRHIVVAGEMLELGPSAAQLHAACGRSMGERGVQIVIGVRGNAESLVAGARAAGSEALFLNTPEEAGTWLKENLQPEDVVLLKASRGVRLERALASLDLDET
ncbi:MAG TPA: UDP-N-acetylmuramoyl-tripeptide--D-alanyl-D-alanine ligase [Acidobacteriaceae bacterium]|jgi:UDP-N-acetylmuramoyl-tripeptide--D-alanyl-D-alanine ligase|nr:UDP-N-acetylmuramoyl-tripeptide--D-alanyl-D-alanine ligase [Acidobacteriaceae bacterium]